MRVRRNGGIGVRWAAAARSAAIVVFGVLVAWALVRVDLQAVRRLLLSLGPAAVLILLPYPIAMALDTLALQRLLPQYTARPSFSRLLLCRLAAEAVAALVPSGGLAGEAVAVRLLTEWGVPLGRAAVSLVARRAVALLTHGLVLASAALLWIPSADPEGGPMPPFGFRASALPPALGTAAAVMTVAAVLLHLVARRAAFRLSPSRSITTGSWRALGGAIPLWTLVWLTEAFETFLILALLGAGLVYSQVLVCESAASLVRGIAFFLPSGVGLQDWAYVGLLQAAGARDALACATAFVLLKRAKELVWIVVGYALLWRTGGTGDEQSAQADPLHLRIAEPDDADAPGRARAAGA